MEASDAWKERWGASTLPMAKTFMEVACRKQSLVCLAADRYTMAELFELLTAVGSSIAALKTHVDLVADWTPGARACRNERFFLTSLTLGGRHCLVRHDSRLDLGGIDPRIHSMEIAVCCSTASQEIEAYSSCVFASREPL